MFPSLQCQWRHGHYVADRLNQLLKKKQRIKKSKSILLAQVGQIATFRLDRSMWPNVSKGPLASATGGQRH